MMMKIRPPKRRRLHSGFTGVAGFLLCSVPDIAVR